MSTPSEVSGLFIHKDLENFEYSRSLRNMVTGFNILLLAFADAIRGYLWENILMKSEWSADFTF